MEGENLVNPDELIRNEEEFLKLCAPSHSFKSEDVVGTQCCSKYCVLQIKRVDILLVRKLYVSYFKSLGNPSKEHARKLFISTMKRGTSNGIFLVPLVENWPVCATVVARTIGISLNTLLNGLEDPTMDIPIFRDWYSKTIDKVSDAMYLLSQHVQFNSLNQIMIPPKYSTRSMDPNSKPLPVKLLRKRMDLQIRQRKADTLVRCVTCIALSEQVEKSTPGDKEAANLLQSHHRIISMQRSILKCLYSQSRDNNFDVLVVNIDSMANRHSKIPVMVQRPKCITDNDRLPLNVTSVQVASQTASSAFSNFDYVTINGLFSHDSSFNVSLLIDTLTKIMPSTLVVVADSARNNKSHVLIGALALLLSRVNLLRTIRLLYPATGHTHNAVDAHFGSISTVLKTENAATPDEFCGLIRNMNGASAVGMTPTIFDFSELLENMHKPNHLCSNSQILLNKDSSGCVYWSSAKTMCSMELFHNENNEASFKCFQDDFNPQDFIPKIRKPATDIVQAKADALVKAAGSFFTDSQRESINASLIRYSKQSFRWQLLQLNDKRPKLTVDSDSTFDEQQVTIIEYLTKKGFNVTKFPKNPVVNDFMV